MENHLIFNGKIHYKWPFSIAMLVYQRVCPNMSTSNPTAEPGNHRGTKRPQSSNPEITHWGKKESLDPDLVMLQTICVYKDYHNYTYVENIWKYLENLWNILTWPDNVDRWPLENCGAYPNVNDIDWIQYRTVIGTSHGAWSERIRMVTGPGEVDSSLIHWSSLGWLGGNEAVMVESKPRIITGGPHLVFAFEFFHIFFAKRLLVVSPWTSKNIGKQATSVRGRVGGDITQPQDDDGNVRSCSNLHILSFWNKFLVQIPWTGGLKSGKSSVLQARIRNCSFVRRGFRRKVPFFGSVREHPAA